MSDEEYVVETRDLEKDAGNRQILKGITLRAARGAVVGLRTGHGRAVFKRFMPAALV